MFIRNFKLRSKADKSSVPWPSENGGRVKNQDELEYHSASEYCLQLPQKLPYSRLVWTFPKCAATFNSQEAVDEEGAEEEKVAEEVLIHAEFKANARRAAGRRRAEEKRIEEEAKVAAEYQLIHKGDF